MDTWIDSLFFFLLLTHLPRVVFSFNLKYKTKLQSNFFFEAFSLAEIQYKKSSVLWIYELLPTVYHGYVFTVLNIYVYPSLFGQPATSKPALSNYFNVGLLWEILILHSDNLLQHLGEHSISTELLQAAWLLPSTKISLDKGSWESSWVFLFFSFFFLFSEIFISSSSSRPYQYITVVFRNSLPSATEDTQEPGISQQLTSCCWRKCTIQDVIVDETLTSKCCPVVFQVSALWIHKPI